MEPSDDSSAPVVVPLGDELDLHTFRPADVPELLTHWLDECARQGFATVRIVHGKGTGTLRRTVQRLLERHPAVEAFETAGESAGGWGATRVRLRPPVPVAP